MSSHGRDELKVQARIGRGKGGVRAPGTQSQATHLLNHITFWVPTLVFLVSVDLDELLEDGNTTAYAFGGKTGAVVKVTVYQVKRRHRVSDFARVYASHLQHAWTDMERERRLTNVVVMLVI